MEFMTQVAKTHITDKIGSDRAADDLVEDPIHLYKYDDTYYYDGESTADEVPAKGLQMVNKGHFLLVRISIKKVESHIKYL
jgi:hypothetical protein